MIHSHTQPVDEFSTEPPRDQGQRHCYKAETKSRTARILRSWSPQKPTHHKQEHYDDVADSV